MRSIRNVTQKSNKPKCNETNWRNERTMSNCVCVRVWRNKECRSHKGNGWLLVHFRSFLCVCFCFQFWRDPNLTWANHTHVQWIHLKLFICLINKTRGKTLKKETMFAWNYRISRYAFIRCGICRWFVVCGRSYCFDVCCVALMAVHVCQKPCETTERR